MTQYKISAKDSHGNLIADTIEAETQRDVIDILHRRGLVVMGIEEVRIKKGVKKSRKKIKLSELSIFSRQLATMVNAGLPLIDGLRILEEQAEQLSFKLVISDIVSQVEGGCSFSETIGRHPKIFGAFFISMAKAGEASGELSEILVRIADYLESINSLRHKVRMAMVYPAVISVMALVITLVLFLKVIPVFEGIFSDFGADLPLPTKVLIALSAWTRRWFFLIAVCVAAAVIAFQRFKKTPVGRQIYDRIKLKLPIVGGLFHKVAISRFSKTLGTLMKSGVPIIASLEIVKEVCGNRQIEVAVEDAAERIREGKSIEEPLAKSGVFPPMVVKMVNVGEKSGRLEEMLDKVSSYYDELVTTMITGLANLIEPLLIVFLGVIVGGIVFSMFLPIFKLSALVGQT